MYAYILYECIYLEKKDTVEIKNKKFEKDVIIGGGGQRNKQL